MSSQLPKDDSLWRAFVSLPKYPELAEDLETDIVIVGGGIMGLSAAYFLKQAGKKVVVLEKDTLGSGTTGNTTGKVTSQHNLTYASLLKRKGKDVARVYGEVNQNAIAQMEALIKKEKISCNWERADNYVYTRNPKQVKEFELEAKAARVLSLPASFEVTSPLPFGITAAVRFADQAKMDTQRYILGLAKVVNKQGSFVFENSHATTIHGHKNAYVTSNGFKVRAKDIIIATNVPTFPLMARGAYCAYEYPHKSYIVAGKIKDMVDGMYISPDNNEYSILPVKSGRDNFLLIGGQNHIPGLGFGAARHYRKLAGFAQERFGIEQIEYQWSARDYQAYDGIPLVGRLYPNSKNTYTATAFKKWGLTHSTAAAIALRDLILGQKNEWADICYPHRPGVVAAIPRVLLSEF